MSGIRPSDDTSPALDLAVAGLLVATIALLWTRYGLDPRTHPDGWSFFLQGMFATLAAMFVGRAIAGVRTDTAD